MKRRTRRQFNNEGSTFILALIIITFVTTLAVAILAAAVSNYMMKSVDRRSKETFYTAETILDEIRAGVGIDTVNNLAKSYEYVLTNIVENNAGVSEMVDNEVANIKFKEKFIDFILDDVTAGLVTFASGVEHVIAYDDNTKDNVTAYLNTFVKGYEANMAKVDSVGGVVAYKNNGIGTQWKVIIEDVIVEYKENKQGEIFFSNITTDLEIEFPNMFVNFSNSNSLTDFTKYVLVADDNINVFGVEAMVRASIYAGNKIDVASNEYRGGKLDVDSDTGENVNVVCGGNLDAQSGSIVATGNPNFRSALSFKHTDIWCTNLVTAANTFGGNGIDQSAGADIDIDGSCSSYVKDDLTSDGKSTTINLNGRYYGYSFNGNATTHSASSAIIINGKNTKLTVGASEMLLGGHAFVELVGSDKGDYMTGEALAFKGDQEVYLVPSKYLAVGVDDDEKISNPTTKTAWDNLVAAAGSSGGAISVCDLSDFFAYKNNYLQDGYGPKAIQHLEPKVIGGKVYIFIKFKNADTAASYIRDVATLSNGADRELRDLLNRYTGTLFSDSFVQVNTDASNIYTKGALLVTANGSTAETHGATVPGLSGNLSYANSRGDKAFDDFELTSIDLTNRYDILTHLLADIPWDQGTNKYIVNDIDTALWQKKDYMIMGEEMNTTSIFNNIVDRSTINVTEYNPEGHYLQMTSTEEGVAANYVKMVINNAGTYRVPSDCNGGIIVATGDVELDHDFKGLILSGGNIKISNNAILTTSQSWVELLIMNELAFRDEGVEVTIPMKEYFFAYKHAAVEDDSREEVKVETVDYKDIVNFNNWRKYEDK